MALLRRLPALILTSLVLAGTVAGAQQQLDETQRLAALCQVWGLLKYYHPQVGERTDWDDVLIAAIPKFKAATNARAFNEAAVSLIGEAGLAYVFREISVGMPRGPLAASAALRWIDDETVFEPETGLMLRAIAVARRPGAGHWVTPDHYTGGWASNPDFSKDQAYVSAPPYPDQHVRLLALCSYWNKVQYYFPYRDVMDRDWLQVLPDLIPKFVQAASALEYHLAVAEMTASINDAHASTSSSTLFTFRGVNAAPIRLGLIENQTTITKIAPRLLDPGVEVQVGDVITHINGAPVETLRTQMRKWVNASNEASLERNIHAYLRKTNDVRLTLTLTRAGGDPIVEEVNTVFWDSAAYDELEAPSNPLSSILPGNIGYIHMGLLQVPDIPGVMAQLRNTRGLVIDLRNYPNSTLSTLMKYFNVSPKPFVKFTGPDYDHPGAFLWSPVFTVGPDGDYGGAGSPASFTYAGAVAVLVNEDTQSQAEFTAMALRTAPSVRIFGSQTAGADGNVSLISIPGGIWTYFSGIGVFYPDGAPTQRIGIVPDVVVKPTIQGLRDGRDEVLEAAVAFLR